MTPVLHIEDVEQASSMNRKELEKLLGDMLLRAWDHLKKLNKLLAEPRNRAAMTDACTTRYMENYRERTFDVLGILEDHIRAAAGKKQRR